MSKDKLTIQNNYSVLTPLLIIFLVAILMLSSKLNKIDRSADELIANGESNTQGKQIVEIKAKGGYSPAIINARANEDTILRVKTQGTFDCSSALVLPKLGIRKNLPPTATTDIPLGKQSAGTKLAGTCSMGMYNFVINFN